MSARIIAGHVPTGGYRAGRPARGEIGRSDLTRLVSALCERICIFPKIRPNSEMLAFVRLVVVIPCVLTG
jgi:hypothetical protein